MVYSFRDADTYMCHFSITHFAVTVLILYGLLSAVQMYCGTDADLDIDVVVSQLKLAGTLYCGLYYLMYLL